MRYLLVALTLTATAAWSQTTSVLQITLPSSQSELRLGKDACGTPYVITWSYNAITAVCDDLHFWLADSCGSDDVPSGTTPFATVTKATVTGTRTGSVTFHTEDLPIFKDGTECPVTGKEQEYKLCAAVAIPGGLAGDCSSNSKQFQTSSASVTYDTNPPAPPTIDKVAPLDQALSVHVTPPSDANRVRVHVARPDGTEVTAPEQSSDETLFKVSGLENGVTYTVTATALDAADNESDASTAEEGTPIHTLGFFDHYVEDGGAETGGCAAAGGLTGGGVMAVLAFWLSSRRKRS